MHDLTYDRDESIRMAAGLYRETFDGGSTQDGALIATADAIHRFRTQPPPDPALTALETRIAALEERMALTDTALEDLNNATNDVAGELDELRTQLSATDVAVAERIGAAANRLRSLAADPEEPVPPVEPTPDEPVPGDQF